MVLLLMRVVHLKGFKSKKTCWLGSDRLVIIINDHCQHQSCNLRLFSKATLPLSLIFIRSEADMKNLDVGF